MSKTKKILLTVIICIIIVPIAFIATGWLYLTNNIDTLEGVRSIELVKTFGGDIELQIKYIDISGYSVKMVDKNEPILMGEKLEVVEELGEYRAKIALRDCELSEAFEKAFLENFSKISNTSSIAVFKDVPKECENKFKLLLVANQDHSQEIWIGSDEEFTVEEKVTKGDFPFGEISVIIK